MTGFEIVVIEPQDAAVVAGRVPVDGLPEFFGTAFQAVMAALEQQGVQVTGPPFGHYQTIPTDVVEVEAGFPTSHPIEAAGEVEPGRLPGGRAVVGVHVGPYETLEQTYAELQTWLADRGLEPGPQMWESYLTDPEAEPDPSRWRTRIVWLVGADAG